LILTQFRNTSHLAKMHNRISEFTKSNEKIDGVVKRLDREKSIFKNGFFTTLIGFLASILGLILAFLNIRAKILEIEKLKRDVQEKNEEDKNRTSTNSIEYNKANSADTKSRASD
jgi:hypothetical protein